MNLLSPLSNFSSPGSWFSPLMWKIVLTSFQGPQKLKTPTKIIFLEQINKAYLSQFGHIAVGTGEKSCSKR